MVDFRKKLFQYMNKNHNTSIDLAPHFKYNETTIIDPMVAQELMSLYNQLDAFIELFDKEKDYNRLLRKENQELTDELNSLYNNCDDEVTSESDCNGGNYVS